MKKKHAIVNTKNIHKVLKQLKTNLEKVREKEELVLIKCSVCGIIMLRLPLVMSIIEGKIVCYCEEHTPKLF